jgi:hypothetical protein
VYGFANGDPINFSDPFGLCPEKETGRKCTLRDVLNFSVSAGGQVGYAVKAGPVSSTLRDQVGPVFGITLGHGGATPSLSTNELSVSSTVTAFGQGGTAKFDFAASDGEQLTALAESQFADGQVGAESTQRGSNGKVSVKFGVGIMFGFGLNFRAIGELLGFK